MTGQRLSRSVLRRASPATDPRLRQLSRNYVTVDMGVVILVVEFLSVSRNGAVIAIGVAFMVVAAMSWMPVFKADAGDLYVRNFLRRRRYQCHEVRSVGLRDTPLLLSRVISFSRLVIDDGARVMVVTATTGMSRQRAKWLLEELSAARFAISSDVTLKEFPIHDTWAAMQRGAEQESTEWEQQQETYWRLERARREREERNR